MSEFLYYLLKVSAGTALFYLCYILFFSRDTFYRRNRIFLILFLLLSLLIPELKIFNIFSADSAISQTSSIGSIIHSGTIISSGVSKKLSVFDANNLFVGFYFLISAFFLVRISVSIGRTIFIIRKGILLKKKFPIVIVSELDHPAFSFFPYVVIPKKTSESGDYHEILTHEEAHISQGHTFDLLFSEFLIVFLWFNPFMWLIKRSIILTHEYLADSLTVKSSNNIKEYQYKLLNIPEGLMNVPLAHNFSNLIKNRIVMINKRPTRNYAALKSLIILPAAAILIAMFSFKPELNPADKGFQQSLFSKTSETQILQFLAMNTGYPQEARNSSDTGIVFVLVKMGRGGVIKDCKAFTDKSSVNVPILPELVIVGYKTSSGLTAVTGSMTSGNDHPYLKAESLRTAKKLSEVKIPEWKDRDIEFAVKFTFTLKKETKK
jgi:beta-lactamase regulating signal transducer with metallopeptidase domain